MNGSRTLAWFLAFASTTVVHAQVTQRVSLDSAGAQGNDFSFYAALSADGRYVAFVSRSSNLVPGGSITAPSYGAGDLQVSARSAALGDTILAGQSRWYLVYYRDPIVLGGCPASSTFNATQTGRVTWSP
jgi:hypothetical protein